MTILPNYDFPETRDVLRGIYPILNIAPETDIDALLDWALCLPEVGIKLVQVRAKRFPEEELPALLDDITSHLKGSGLAVILNDYIELVRITGADGVHIGLDDFPVFEARAMLGQKTIIGTTCRNHAEALLATGQGSSYVAVGSIFASPTKSDVPIAGLEGLRQVIEHIERESVPRKGWGRFGHVPICAIGGITKENLGDVYSAGASMAAVISAIQDAADPIKAAGELVEEWGRLDLTPFPPLHKVERGPGG